jgi:hypothetical protein
MTAPIVEQGSPSTTAALRDVDLWMMTHEELVALFHRLPAPSFEEMNGEFARKDESGK